MTRLWVSGKLITVTLDEQGCPTAFHWEGQRHPVQKIANQWRVDLDWWRWRIWRDYFKLTTRTGLLVVVYHDLVFDQWFLQRLYD